MDVDGGGGSWPDGTWDDTSARAVSARFSALGGDPADPFS